MLALLSAAAGFFVFLKFPFLLQLLNPGGHAPKSASSLRKPSPQVSIFSVVIINYGKRMLSF
jgi:hypothetical protein